MNNLTLEKICAELSSTLVGKKFGKIFPLARFQMAIDFRLSDSQYLFISVEPVSSRIYIIKRRLKDLEKQSINPSPFVLFLRKRLANAVLQKIEKFENERILRLAFAAQTEIGESENYSLIVQLTGRSANIFLLDANDFVLDSLRENSGEGQEIAGKFAPPFRAGERAAKAGDEIFPQGDFTNLSEALDTHFQEIEAEKQFRSRVKSFESRLNQELKKREKLLQKLNQDLENHGDAEKWKRFGDLILANLANAVREGEKVLVTDFYDENVPLVEIEIDENLSLTEAAERFFKRYTKARNAEEEISKRLEVLHSEIFELKEQKARLDEAVETRDETILEEFSSGKSEQRASNSKEKSADKFSGARNYLSSDGFEILVGKGSKDNDFLTFRVAKSSDLWLHAADYPGSHVVVKNPNRGEIPQKTLIEAAQLAAFFSRAKAESKVAVHYAQKKFVNKPKGAVAGLVSLSSFKTILVEPKPFENQNL